MMEYVAHRRIDMRRDPTVSEKWLQERILADPTLLGLGDVDVKDYERRQSGAGRLDLLLHDPETNTRYEAELQLGATDESHIIRTIEYWDNERRRYPQYEHVAVIVAEDITARFFNVISLLNGQIPIIAIHVQLLEVQDARTLVFTRVLDHVTLATDDEDEAAEPTDRSYWIAKGSEKTVQLADRLIAIAQQADASVALNYNKHYIGMMSSGVAKNFVICRPRRAHLIVEFKLPQDEARKDEHEALGFDVLPYDKRWGNYRLRLTAEDFDQRSEALSKLAAEAEHYYRSRTGDT
jgi:hypothetical protein